MAKAPPVFALCVVVGGVGSRDRSRTREQSDRGSYSGDVARLN